MSNNSQGCQNRPRFDRWLYTTSFVDVSGGGQCSYSNCVNGGEERGGLREELRGRARVVGRDGDGKMGRWGFHLLPVTCAAFYNTLQGNPHGWDTTLGLNRGGVSREGTLMHCTRVASLRKRPEIDGFGSVTTSH